MDEWVYSSGKACYNSEVAGYTLVQPDKMEIGKLYAIRFTLSNMTRGKINIPSIAGGVDYIENGTYNMVGKALFTDIVVLPGNYLGVFNGCIDDIEVMEIPYYSIVDSDGDVVYTSDGTGVTSAGGVFQYNIDWSDLEEGCYYLKFTDSILEYQTDCFTVKLTHDCTKQITWNSNENAFNFNYSDLSFTQTLRIEADLWKPSWKALDKEVFDYSNGDLEITYVSKVKEQLFTTEDLPEYLHDALSLALDSDNFFIDGKKFVFPDDETSPAWRNSSSLAPIEVKLRHSQNLTNVNCG